MASLLDIANTAPTVPIRGTDVAVYGVSAHGIAGLMSRFPEIGKAFAGIQPTREDLMKVGPDALAAFIAAGTGQLGDAKAEKVARDLSVGDQLTLVEKILDQTFPKGIRPFVMQMQELGLLAKGAVASAQERSQPSLQEQSKSSQPQVTETSGATPQK